MVDETDDRPSVSGLSGPRFWLSGRCPDHVRAFERFARYG